MKFLLDTHAVLWIAESSPRLSAKIRTLAGK
jgi:PIN domain nuclease of toxin-antitoxin system